MNKIVGLFLVAIEKNNVIMRVAWQRSSVVEQRNHNPLVGGPNPSAATRISRCSGIFLFRVICPNLCDFCDFTQIVLHILDIISDIDNMFTCVILLLALHYEL